MEHTQHAIMNENTKSTSPCTSLFPVQIAKMRKAKMAPEEKTTKQAPSVLRMTAARQC